MLLSLVTICKGDAGMSDTGTGFIPEAPFELKAAIQNGRARN